LKIETNQKVVTQFTTEVLSTDTELGEFNTTLVFIVQRLKYTYSQKKNLKTHMKPCLFLGHNFVHKNVDKK